MIPVYIRDTITSEHHFLGWFPSEALDGLVAAVRSWGVYTARTDSMEAVGQFFALDGRAGFEINVHDEPDA